MGNKVQGNMVLHLSVSDGRGTCTHPHIRLLRTDAPNGSDGAGKEGGAKKWKLVFQRCPACHSAAIKEFGEELSDGEVLRSIDAIQDAIHDVIEHAAQEDRQPHHKLPPTQLSEARKSPKDRRRPRNGGGPFKQPASEAAPGDTGHSEQSLTAPLKSRRGRKAQGPTADKHHEARLPGDAAGDGRKTFKRSSSAGSHLNKADHSSTEHFSAKRKGKAFLRSNSTGSNAITCAEFLTHSGTNKSETEPHNDGINDDFAKHLAASTKPGDIPDGPDGRNQQDIIRNALRPNRTAHHAPSQNNSPEKHQTRVLAGSLTEHTPQNFPKSATYTYPKSRINTDAESSSLPGSDRQRKYRSKEGTDREKPGKNKLRSSKTRHRSSLRKSLLEKNHPHDLTDSLLDSMSQSSVQPIVEQNHLPKSNPAHHAAGGESRPDPQRRVHSDNLEEQHKLTNKSKRRSNKAAHRTYSRKGSSEKHLSNRPTESPIDATNSNENENYNSNSSLLAHSPCHTEKDEPTKTDQKKRTGSKNTDAEIETHSLLMKGTPINASQVNLDLEAEKCAFERRKGCGNVTKMVVERRMCKQGIESISSKVRRKFGRKSSNDRHANQSCVDLGSGPLLLVNENKGDEPKSKRHGVIIPDANETDKTSAPPNIDFHHPIVEWKPPTNSSDRRHYYDKEPPDSKTVEKTFHGGKFNDSLTPIIA